MRTPTLLILAIVAVVVMWALLVGGTIDDQPAVTPPAPEVFHAESIFDPPPAIATTSSTTTTSSTSTTVAARARTAPTVPPTNGKRLRLSSTEYCETGHMANGLPAHDGAVSSKVLARGSRWRVLTGRYAGRVFTVEDTGSLAIFDIAVPGRCPEAVAYGRQPIEIEAA